MLEDFPERPKGMHRRTYDQLHEIYDRTVERSSAGLMEAAVRMRERLAAHVERKHAKALGNRCPSLHRPN